MSNLDNSFFLQYVNTLQNFNKEALAYTTTFQSVLNEGLTTSFEHFIVVY